MMATETPLAKSASEQALQREQNCPGEGQSSEVLEVPPISREMEVQTAEEEVVVVTVITDEAEVQCELLTDCECSTEKEPDYVNWFSVRQFKDNPTGIKYFTGFEDYRHFKFFLNVLGPAAYDLNYKCESLSAEDHLFLTLMKLRQDKEDVELSVLFDINESTVESVQNTWINFIYYQLSEVDFFADDYGENASNIQRIEQSILLDSGMLVKDDSVKACDCVDCHVNTLADISCDCMECLANTQADSLCDCEDCPVDALADTSCNRTDCHGDTLADSLCDCEDCPVNTPAILKGKSKLKPVTFLGCRRAHVENVISLTKTFKILKKYVQNSKDSVDSKIIIKVCYMIAHFFQRPANK